MDIAIDFDGVLCREAWPEIGEENKAATEWVRKAKENGHKIILWTCRTGKELEEALEWCFFRGIVFDAVNENLPERTKKYGSDPRKIGADLYIDDKSTTWEAIQNGSYQHFH